MVLQGRFEFFDGAYFGPHWPLMQGAAEFQEMVLGAGGIDFNAAIGEVAGESPQPKGRGAAADKVAIPDALDAPADEPSPC